MTWLDRNVLKTLPNALETTVSIPLQDTELTCRYILFLCTDNKHKEKNHRHTPIYNTLTEKKNLTKKVNDLHIENFKNLKKDIRNNTSKWKDIPHSRIGGISIVKLIIPPKAIGRINAILMLKKNPLLILQRNRKNKNNARGVVSPDFKHEYTKLQWFTMYQICEINKLEKR